MAGCTNTFSYLIPARLSAFSFIPVVATDKLNTFYAAVARKDLEGYPEDGFQMENALSREETLKAMTIWAAKSSFEEDKKGSIEVGKFADFVMLAKDLMTAPEPELPTIKILSTYLGGEQVFKNE